MKGLNGAEAFMRSALCKPACRGPLIEQRPEKNQPAGKGYLQIMALKTVEALEIVIFFSWDSLKGMS